MMLSLAPVLWVGLLGAFEDPPTYERDIRPILASRCTICHNKRDAGDPEISVGLSLDSYEAVLKGSPKSKVAVAGKVAESPLYGRLVLDNLEKRMPLYEDPLPDAQRDLFRRWIEAGLPRGEPVARSAKATKAARRFVRSLDVAIKTDAKVPTGLDGLPAGASVEIVAKLGPLPAVSALAFRGDGRVLAVGSLERVTLWDLRDGRPSATLAGLPGAVHALAFSRDGRRLAVGAGLPGRSGSVWVYTVPDGAMIRDFEGHTDVVYALAFRPDDAQLASAGFDGTVRLWDLADGLAAGVFKGHSDFVYDVAYATDGRSVLSASKDRSVKRFDAGTLKGLVTYSDHDDDVLALAIRPDGLEFVSAGNEPQLRWWRLDGEKPSRKVGGHSGPVHQLAFSRDGRRLISAGGDGTVRLWDGASGSFQKSLPGASDWQYAVALSSDGRLAASGGWDGFVRLWDAEGGKLLATLLQPPAEEKEGGDWLAVVSTGYVDASTRLLDELRWRAGQVEARGEAVDKVFVRPDKLSAALRGEVVPSPIVERTEVPK